MTEVHAIFEATAVIWKRYFNGELAAITRDRALQPYRNRLHEMVLADEEAARTKYARSAPTKPST